MYADDDWTQGNWFALRDGELAPFDGGQARLRVIDVGELVLRSGDLGACDPFVALEHCPVWAQVPAGSYPVRLSIADVSEHADGSHDRHAYLTLLVDADAEEHTRRCLGKADAGFGVDTGSACFVDASAISEGMPDPEQWFEGLFEAQGGWFSRMDDPAHVAPGVANIELPVSNVGANVVVVRSGWGDGVYPVVGGYDADGRLVRVHLDFYVVGGPEPEVVVGPAVPVHEPRPNAALGVWLAVIAPWFVVALGLELGPEVTSMGGLALTAAVFVVLWKAGWVKA